MNKKIQLNLASVLAFFVATLFVLGFQQGRLWTAEEKLGYMRADTELTMARAQARLDQCVDMAADNRDEALMSEEAWMNAIDDLGYCEFWEEYGDGLGHGQCLGPEYWSSYSPLVGPNHDHRAHLEAVGLTDE